MFVLMMMIRSGTTHSNSSAAETNRAPLPLEAVIHQAPREATDAGRNVSDDASHHSAQVRSQGAASIKAEPPDPQEDRSEDDVCNVVRPVGEALDLGVTVALAQHDGVCQSRSARRDVDGRAAGEVEAAELEGPAVCIPRPVGNRVVDDRRPDEDKNKGRQHAAAVGDCADGKSWRDGGEHALVQAEQQVRDLGAADAGLAQDLHEAEVGQVTDEGAASVTKGKRITPEEPLETDDSYAHHGQPDESQC